MNDIRKPDELRDTSGAATPKPATAPKASLWPRLGLWLAGVIGVLLVSGLAGGYATYLRWQKSEVIAPNIVIRGEPVGGLTRAAARQRLQDRFGRLFLTIRTPARPYHLALHQLGGEPQIENVVNLAYSRGRAGSLLENLTQLLAARNGEERLNLPVRWDKEQLKRKMWTIALDYRQPARDAQLTVGEQGVQVVSEEKGRSLNVGETLLNLQKKYHPGVEAMDAVTRTVLPSVTAVSLSGRDVLLGRYRTAFNSGVSGRTRNIHVAAAALDGQVLMPGEEFSFNKMTGERTYEKGYRMAKIFERKPGEVKSEIVDGLAGGVCQVSSTLFNAVRRTNEKTASRLRITERNFHSLPVTYVPEGLDATVAWPNRDFRFRNNFPHPVYIRATVDGSRLAISIWGRVPNDVNTVTVANASAGATEDASSDARSS
jgi:vancomycin resistance protein YoaR